METTNLDVTLEMIRDAIAREDVFDLVNLAKKDDATLCNVISLLCAQMNTLHHIERIINHK
jgi:hypothetical protein